MTEQTVFSDETYRAEVLSRAAALIAPEHLTAQTLESVSTWLSEPSDRPMVFRNFLRQEAAEATAAAMRALPVWARHVTAYRNLTETEAIDERDWPGHPERAACHFVAQPLTAALEPGAMAAEHQDSLRRFLSFAVITNRFRDWISLATGVPLNPKEASVELAAYGRGDQIRPHQDLFPNRVLGGNFYLDQDYRVGQGGRLGYRVDGGAETLVDPLFNTLSLFQIRADGYHWVEPFEPETIGRYTVSIGLHRVS
ncbi:2OG-Fe(II) oxygenase [Kitasatospora sp. NPDC059571]|uniref:2OG-Fe(II) oxygenase n=1 Tax=Kitasatospora sp. NPDC059571 TaxID=3346871 RepID=UPI0036B1EC39